MQMLSIRNQLSLISLCNFVSVQEVSLRRVLKVGQLLRMCPGDDFCNNKVTHKAAKKTKQTKKDLGCKFLTSPSLRPIYYTNISPPWPITINNQPRKQGATKNLHKNILHVASWGGGEVTAPPPPSSPTNPALFFLPAH